MSNEYLNREPIPLQPVRNSREHRRDVWLLGQSWRWQARAMQRMCRRQMARAIPEAAT